MTAYRFCRTDDMPLLVAAYEACRGPEDEGAPRLDRDGLRRLVREVDLWCSSCMVALEGRQPVGVLLGAKRDAATLVWALRVHPEHRRRGHGRHLLTSLSQKLAILGPPRLVAEVPASRAAACALLAACGWNVEDRLTDWQRPAARGDERTSTNETGGLATSASASSDDELALVRQASVAPLRADELPAEAALAARAHAWHHDPTALARLGDPVRGLGFRSPDGLEAWLFWRHGGEALEILLAGSTASGLGAPGLALLLEELARQAAGAPVIFLRVASSEAAPALLGELGFTPGAEHLLYATRAEAA